MSTIQLTSYNRMIRYLSDMTGTNKTASSALRTDLTEWIRSTSAQIEQWTGREMLLQSYTEYFDVRYGQMRFRAKGVPVTSITSFKTDPEGMYAGGEETVDSADYHIGRDGLSIDVNFDIGYEGRSGVQIVYTGGLGNSGSRTTMVVAPDSGDTFTAGRFVTGSLSGSLGLIVSWTVGTTTLVVDTLRGRWETGDVLTEYTAEDETGGTNNTGTVSSVTYRAMCEEYPDLVRACEMQVRYLYKHKHDFEMVGSTREGVNLRQSSPTVYTIKQPFTQEVITMLEPYRLQAV